MWHARTRVAHAYMLIGADLGVFDQFVTHDENGLRRINGNRGLFAADLVNDNLDGMRTEHLANGGSGIDVGAEIEFESFAFAAREFEHNGVLSSIYFCNSQLTNHCLAGQFVYS